MSAFFTFRKKNVLKSSFLLLIVWLVGKKYVTLPRFREDYVLMIDK